MKNVFLALLMTATLASFTAQSQEKADQPSVHTNLLKKAPANPLLANRSVGCFQNCNIQRRICVFNAISNGSSTFRCEVAFEACISTCF